MRTWAAQPAPFTRHLRGEGPEDPVGAGTHTGNRPRTRPFTAEQEDSTRSQVAADNCRHRLWEEITRLAYGPHRPRLWSPRQSQQKDAHFHLPSDLPGIRAPCLAFS